MSPTRKITLGHLTDDDLHRCPAWRETGRLIQGDEVLEPVQLTSDGCIPPSAGEVWCRCVCRFSNGQEHVACAVCSADSGEGPHAWSISHSSGAVRLILP